MMESGISDCESLTTDIDSLFEKYTVKQLHDLEKNVRVEIEKKKEDVRQMVGERYRDLIEAADTITEMKKSIHNVTLHVSSMEAQVAALEKTDFSTKPLQFRHSKKEDLFQQYLNLAAQIKLLLDIPGKIWCLIEANQFLSAAKLFLLARHIHSSLMAEPRLGIPVTSWFPVVTRQWMTTGHFKMTLIEACKNTFQQHCVTAEILCQCCGALLILSSISIQDVCTDFLNARLKCIQELFRPDKHDSSIKQQICEAVELIISTIELLHSVFLDGISENSPSLLVTTLNTVLDSQFSNPSPHGSDLSSLSEMSLSNSSLDFNFVIPQSIATMSQMELRDKAVNWIQEVKFQVKKDVSQMLNYVTSIRGLAVVRDSVCEVINKNKKNENWSIICNQLLQNELLLWDDIIQSLFLEQMKIIVEYRLKEAFGAVNTKLTEFIETAEQDRVVTAERDVSAFIWAESTSDLPTKIGWMSASSRNICDGGNLLMKARGFTPFPQSLCSLLNSQLTVLIEDIAHFYSGSVDSDTMGEESRLFLRNASAQQIKRLLESSERLVKEQKGLLKAQDVNAELCLTRILALSRVLNGLTELSPALQCCIIGLKLNQEENSLKKMLSRRESKMIEDTRWQNTKKTLLGYSHKALGHWKDIVIEQLAVHLRRTMNFNTSSEILLYLPQWETVDIQEENEDGKVVTSKIRIPGQASWTLLNTLYSLCSEINRAGGHCLPRTIIQALQVDIADVILKSHEDLPLIKDAKISQVLALQLLFDMNFVCSLMSVKDHKMLAKRVQNLTDLLVSHVDPFDLDVFTPHIQSNLRRSIQRSSILLGSLVNPTRTGLFSSANRSSSSSSQSEQHNILVSSPAPPPRFSLLPLPSRLGVDSGDRNKSESTRMNTIGIADAAYKVIATQTDKRNQVPLSSSANSLNLSFSPVKSTAASIFEAVSSGWLRN